MTKKQEEKARKLLESMALETQIFQQQIKNGTYEGNKGIKKVLKLSDAHKVALLDKEKSGK